MGNMSWKSNKQMNSQYLPFQMMENVIRLQIKLLTSNMQPNHTSITKNSLIIPPAI